MPVFNKSSCLRNQTLLLEIQVTANLREAVIDQLLPRLEGTMVSMGFTKLSIVEEKNIRAKDTQVFDFHIYYDLFSLSVGVRPENLHNAVMAFNQPDAIRVVCKLIANASQINQK